MLSPGLPASHPSNCLFAGAVKVQSGRVKELPAVTGTSPMEPVPSPGAKETVQDPAGISAHRAVRVMSSETVMLSPGLPASHPSNC